MNRIAERLSGSGGPLALVVAHPDDETLALGGTMPDMPGLLIVHVTDGAPRDERDARAHGFADWRAYAAARRVELKAAVALAGVTPRQLHGLDYADQDASNHLVPITRRLAEILTQNRTRTVVTHAYEGGHPDHDAVAFAVHAAAALMARHGTPPLRIGEVPLYHEGDHGFAGQRFVDPRPDDVVVSLDAEALARRRSMLACHASQAETLAQFDARDESLRWSDPDFTALPNRGRLYYVRFGWTMDGEGWLARTVAARRELGLP